MLMRVVIGLLIVICSQSWAHDKITFHAVPESENLPFSDAVQVGNLLFLAGKLGTFPGTRDLAPGGIKGQTKQAMERIKTAVESYGSSMTNVVKCTVFLADMDEWAEMNEVYTTFFPGGSSGTFGSWRCRFSAGCQGGN